MYRNLPGSSGSGSCAASRSRTCPHPRSALSPGRPAKAGAEIVIVHGETTVEPVAPGTNHAACTCPDVNVLAHPGLITHEDARLGPRERHRP